jgi:hypothetical protein
MNNGPDILSLYEHFISLSVSGKQMQFKRIIFRRSHRRKVLYYMHSCYPSL